MRLTATAGLLLALAGVAAWFVLPSWWPAIDPYVDPYGSFLRPLAWPALLAVSIGLVPKVRRLVPGVLALLIAGAASWFGAGAFTPFLAGAVHGLLLGLVVRVVAWGLGRDRATCLLGAAVGRAPPWSFGAGPARRLPSISRSRG